MIMSLSNTVPISTTLTATNDVVTPLPHQPLRQCVQIALQNYFAQLDGQAPKDLYTLVLAEVEAPLLTAVLQQTKGNQSKAAQVLGLSRGTLRKKIKQYALE